MTLAELGDLPQLRRQLLQVAGSAEPLDRTQLLVGRTARANQVRMVGVGEAIRARAGRAEDGALLEDEDGAARAGECEHALDRVQPFGISDGVPASVGDPELDSFFGGEACEEVSALRFGAAKLEVRRARAAQRAAAQQRAAQVGAAATGARDDAARRCRERCEPGAQDACFVQHLQRMLVAGDMKLVARSTVEGATLVRANLGRDAEAAEQAEGAASNGGVGDVEVDGDLATAAQMDTPGGVEETGELCPAVALASRRDRRELVAEVLRE